jgi:hypothetical protein
VGSINGLYTDIIDQVTTPEGSAEGNDLVETCYSEHLNEINLLPDQMLYVKITIDDRDYSDSTEAPTTAGPRDELGFGAFLLTSDLAKMSCPSHTVVYAEPVPRSSNINSTTLDAIITDSVEKMRKIHRNTNCNLPDCAAGQQ